MSWPRASLQSTSASYRVFRHACPNTRTLRTQPRSHGHEHSESDQTYTPLRSSVATPRELVEYLSQYVVGQEQAKKVLSVAVFNHYNRVRANLAATEPEEYASFHEPDIDGGDAPETARLRPLRKRVPSIMSLRSREKLPLFEKSNVLVLGPTGSGKTLLARTLAKVLDVPFSISDATSFTQAGYVGEDVDAAIQRLVQAANWDPIRASTGIVYIDEIDKIARRSSSGSEGSRDVGGEGVQQALLRMLEGAVVTVQAKGGGAIDTPPPDPTTRGGQRVPHIASTPKPDMYHIDTSNVLFILSGAFVGLDKIIKQRLAKGSIGFTATLASDTSLPFFTSNRKTPHNPLDLVETSDLVQYGFIPEFVGRLPSITSLAPLTIPDLRRILTEVKGSLISQYTSLFGYSSIEIRFTSAAIDEICKKAFERGGGARGLRGIMEKLLLDPMYEAPGSAITHVLITTDTVNGVSPPVYWKRGQGMLFWQAWAKEEELYSQKKTDTA